jgi:hypothetical protein
MRNDETQNNNNNHNQNKNNIILYIYIFVSLSLYIYTCEFNARHLKKIRQVRILVWPRRCSNCSSCSLLQRPSGHGQWNQSFIQSTALGSCTSSHQNSCLMLSVYHPLMHDNAYKIDILRIYCIRIYPLSRAAVCMIYYDPKAWVQNGRQTVVISNHSFYRCCCKTSAR